MSMFFPPAVMRLSPPPITACFPTCVWYGTRHEGGHVFPSAVFLERSVASAGGDGRPVWVGPPRLWQQGGYEHVLSGHAHGAYQAAPRAGVGSLFSHSRPFRRDGHLQLSKQHRHPHTAMVQPLDAAHAVCRLLLSALAPGRAVRLSVADGALRTQLERAHEPPRAPLMIFGGKLAVASALSFLTQAARA